MSLTIKSWQVYAFIAFWAITDRLRELPLFWVEETWITCKWFLTTNGPEWLWVFADGYHFFKWIAVVALCVLLTRKFLPTVMLLVIWFMVQVAGQIALTWGS